MLTNLITGTNHGFAMPIFGSTVAVAGTKRRAVDGFVLAGAFPGISAWSPPT